MYADITYIIFNIRTDLLKYFIIRTSFIKLCAVIQLKIISVPISFGPCKFQYDVL
jgi:hypothetical protein